MLGCGVLEYPRNADRFFRDQRWSRAARDAIGWLLVDHL